MAGRAVRPFGDIAGTLWTCVRLANRARDGFEAAHNPFFELLAGTLGQFLEADTGPPETIGPGDVAFGLHDDLRARQGKLHLSNCVLRQDTLKMNCYSAFAEVGRGGFEFFALAERELHGHFDRATEVATLLAHHEAHGGVEAAQGSGRGDG